MQIVLRATIINFLSNVFPWILFTFSDTRDIQKKFLIYLDFIFNILFYLSRMLTYEIKKIK